MVPASAIIWEPLGDQAVLATFPTELLAAAFAAAARALPAPWQIDTVLAYLSVAVFYDFDQTDYATVVSRLQSLSWLTAATPGKQWEIPCCYELGPDLAAVAAMKGISTAQVIALHLSQLYTVYAIGFTPGFPYLGYLPEGLQGIPRRASPRTRVEPGSVGITGKQTGIYPLPTPGGWQLLGRTPLEMVHVAEGYFPLRAGDIVRFVRIGESEFLRRRGERLQG
jgi:inhibitor of KinA